MQSYRQNHLEWNSSVFYQGCPSYRNPNAWLKSTWNHRRSRYFCRARSRIGKREYLLEYFKECFHCLFNLISHKEWLVKHARPRKDHTKLDAKSFNETSQKLTREGLMRIQKLAKPLSRYRKSKIKPISRRFMRVVGFANERVIELSRPKCRFDRNDEYLPEAPKVSKSAMSYEGENLWIPWGIFTYLISASSASERIKALAQPKKFIRCPFNSNEDLSQDFNCKCICCNHSQSCMDLSDCSNDFSSCASVSRECEESDSIRKGTPEDGSICEVSCESVSQSMDCTEQWIKFDKINLHLLWHQLNAWEQKPRNPMNLII